MKSPIFRYTWSDLSKDIEDLSFMDYLYVSGDTEGHSGYSQSQYPFKLSFNVILLCLRGHVRLRLNLKEYVLTANNIFVACEGSIGEFCGGSEDGCMIAIIIRGGHYRQNFKPDVFQKALEIPLIPISEEDKNGLAFAHLQMKRWIKSSYPVESIKPVIDGYIQIWLSTIYLKIADLESLTSSKLTSHQLYLKNFLELVRNHYTENRSVSFYAEKMCLTPKYLAQIIYKVSGRYASDWINDFIILEAKALLKQGIYSVSQISDMLNFSNPSFFCKYFKKHVGCTPVTYIKSNSINLI